MTTIIEQPPVTGPGPAPKKKKLSWPKRIAIGFVGLVAAITAICLAAGGGGSTPSAKPSAAPSASAPATSAPASPLDQLQAWYYAHGQRQVAAVGTDMQALSTDMSRLSTDVANGTGTAGDVSALQTDVRHLQSDIQSAQSDLPPAAIPGLRGHYLAALDDYSMAATDINEALTAVGNGDYSTATTDILNAAKAMNAGSDQIQAAIADIQSHTG